MEMGHRMGHSRQAQGTAPAEDSGYRVVRTRPSQVRDFSVFHPQRFIGGNFNLGTEYARIACGRILGRDRKLISTRC